MLPTLSSRCLPFRISLSNDDVLNISNKLLNSNIYQLINKELLNYYSTPGQIYNLVKFSKELDIDIKHLDLKSFLSLLINESYYKKNNLIKNIIFEFVELFLVNKISLEYSFLYSYFLLIFVTIF